MIYRLSVLFYRVRREFSLSLSLSFSHRCNTTSDTFIYDVCDVRMIRHNADEGDATGIGGSNVAPSHPFGATRRIWREGKGFLLENSRVSRRVNWRAENRCLVPDKSGPSADYIFIERSCSYRGYPRALRNLPKFVPVVMRRLAVTTATTHRILPARGGRRETNLLLPVPLSLPLSISRLSPERYIRGEENNSSPGLISRSSPLKRLCRSSGHVLTRRKGVNVIA